MREVSLQAAQTGILTTMNLPIPSPLTRFSALFLDRDGVLTPERGYVTDPDQLTLLPGAAEAVACWNAAAVPVFVYTNQSGVGRGLLTLETLKRIHVRLRELLAEGGAALTEVYACPHVAEEGCICRKPRAGMLLQASREHSISLASGMVVGDSARDLAAGRAVGASLALVLSGHTSVYAPEQFSPPPDFVSPNLASLTAYLSR